MSIHDILSKGGCIEDLEEDPQVEEQVENGPEVDDEEWEGFSDEEPNAEDDAEIPVEVPVEIVTRSGRQICKPSRYGD